MQQINCSSDFPLQLLYEMRRDHPEILKSTQFVITLSGEQLMQLSDMAQKAAEANIERYFERMMHNDITLQRVTTSELKEQYHISPTTANKLQHEGWFTDVIKIGRQNGYLRTEVLNYIAKSKQII